jgi:hypothetical protein
MASLTLEQFRDIKLRGFPGWETAVTPGYEGATPYVDPVDARFGAPSHPFGTDSAAIGPAFERWCADNFAGDYFVAVTGALGGLVYCQLQKDADLVRRSFGVPPTAFGALN